MSNLHPIFQDIVDGLQLDPREHVIERYGHLNFYTSHTCPKCEQESPCNVKLCKLPFMLECLPCATRELLEDTERIAEESREFIRLDPQGLEVNRTWWLSLRTVIDGKLKGLAERSAELRKRSQQ